MEVNNKTMYHLHRLNIYPELWVEGSTIDNTSKDFLSNYTSSGNNTSYLEQFDNEYLPFYQIIRHYRKSKPDDNTIDILLEYSDIYIHNLLICQRENALEEVRREYYPNKISRREAIWVCDEPQIITWKKDLPGDRELLKVAVSGTMFVSSADFLPSIGISYNESLEMAHNYWNPDFNKCDESSLEYLVKGKIKVLKKI